MHDEEESGKETEVSKALPTPSKRRSQREERRCGGSLPQQGRSVESTSIYNRVDELLTEWIVLIPSAHNNARSYSDEHVVNNVTVSIGASPTKRSINTTVPEGRVKQTTSVCASSVKDEVEFYEKLYMRWDAANRRNLQQLPGTDEVCLNIQDYNDLRKRLKVAERRSVFLESSENPWKGEFTRLNRKLNKALVSGECKLFLHQNVQNL